MGTEVKLFVKYNEIDGRSYFDLSVGYGNKDISLRDIRAILTGAVAMTIRLSENDVEAMTEVINLLNEQFVSPHAFEDGKLKKII
jgi:hypothetical protein